MLQTYEAILDHGQFRWIDEVPAVREAHLWVTVQPKIANTKQPLSESLAIGMIELLTRQPVTMSQESQFLTREQANER